jgi:hypothetical protein
MEEHEYALEFSLENNFYHLLRLFTNSALYGTSNNYNLWLNGRFESYLMMIVRERSKKIPQF